MSDSAAKVFNYRTNHCQHFLNEQKYLQHPKNQQQKKKLSDPDQSTESIRLHLRGNSGSGFKKFFFLKTELDMQLGKSCH